MSATNLVSPIATMLKFIPAPTLLCCALLLGSTACSDDEPADEAGETGDSGDGDGDGDIAEVVDCEADLAPPADGSVCTAEGVAGGSLALRGDVLAPETVYLGGTVVIEAGLITYAGCEPPATDATITCADAAISPGLINTHEHLGFANNWPIGEGVDRYEHRHDWRIGKNGHAEYDYNSGASDVEMRAAELRFVMGGATSTASGGDTIAGLLRNVDDTDTEGLPIDPASSSTLPLDDANGIQQADSCSYGDDPIDEGYASSRAAFLPHIAEGIDQYAHNELVCATSDPDILAPNTAIVHATGATLEDVGAIVDSGAQVIWSPRSNVVLYGATAPVTLLDTLGVNLALGTDWIATGSMNMLRELACADYLDEVHYGDRFSDKQLWAMATTNAAFAIGAELGLGMIKPGYVADLAIFANGDDASAELHGAVVRGHEARVALVLRGGVPLYGDADLLASAAIGGSDCEPLDVCDVAKRACVEADTSQSLATVMAASGYPLGFCPGEVPADEPSCVPWREVEYPDGVTESDQDGDGLSDELDLCPDVFSPLFTTGVVPLWDEQPDADLDGIGDVCDPTPCDDCTPISANDFDQDGIANGVDNCPSDANSDQADADDDGKGDVCDMCAQSNPGFAECSTTIEALADESHPEHPPLEATVTVTGAYVTAVQPNGDGFWMETGTQAPFTGISVFGGAPVQVGDVVDVTGTYVEFFGLVQLADVSVTVVASGDPLPFGPLVVDAASIATGGSSAEQYEAMLLQVDDVVITTLNADAPDDYDEFTVTGDLRVNDINFEALDNTCAVGSGFDSIIGTLDFSFSNTKLSPRDANDLVGSTCEPF